MGYWQEIAEQRFPERKIGSPAELYKDVAYTLAVLVSRIEFGGSAHVPDDTGDAILDYFDDVDGEDLSSAYHAQAYRAAYKAQMADAVANNHEQLDSMLRLIDLNEITNTLQEE